MTLLQFRNLIRGGMRYEFDGEGKLTLTNYHTGESVTLDLMEMDEETFEALKAEEE